MNRIEAMVSPLYGIPSWRAFNSYGSMFLMDFGQPLVEVQEPKMLPTRIDGGIQKARQRGVQVRGQWTLCIELCAWALDIDGWLLAHDESTRNTINRAMRVLQGQALACLRIEPGSGAAVFAFDLGATLRTRAEAHEVYREQDDGDDEPVSQWWLMGPGNRVLDVRDDATYSIHDDGASPTAQEWLPLREA